MGFKCGIVGLPNVGKSTIFNALTSGAAEAANYPFCTIEPNTGIVAVPDARLEALSNISRSEKLIPTTIEFVDIAGLVKGASEGEGLGNQFLSHIRAVDAIIHIVRCFEDDDITHVEGSVDPARDIDLIETELLLSDLASVERRLERSKKALKGGGVSAEETHKALLKAQEVLAEGRSLRSCSDEEKAMFQGLDCITLKPVLFVGNVSEAGLQVRDSFQASLLEAASKRMSDVIFLSGQVESELALLEPLERADFLKEMGIEQSGLEKLAQAGYRLLHLFTYFTSGEKETRAWTVHEGATAVDAAGVIHTDFAKGFIRAEVISYEDFISCQGESGAKEKGKLRTEGKTYLVQDGDVIHFRFNV